MSKIVARTFMAIGGVWFSAWMFMLLIERLDSVWGIGSISFDDSIGVVTLFYMLLFGVACIGASFSSRGE